MNPDNQEQIERAFKTILEKVKTHGNRISDAKIPRISIGMATCGLASGALETRNAIEEALAERNMEARLRAVGCIGHCYAEPVVIIDNPGFPPLFYHQVTPGKGRMLVKSFLEEGDPLFEYLLGAMEENELIPQVADFPRFNLEKRVVMVNCGLINPEDIYDYIAEGGYRRLAKAIQQPPGEMTVRSRYHCTILDGQSGQVACTGDGPCRVSIETVNHAVINRLTGRIGDLAQHFIVFGMAFIDKWFPINIIPSNGVFNMWQYVRSS